MTTAIGEPTWEVARLFPAQGEWTEEDYCALNTNQLVELSDGCLEFLPTPTEAHQLLIAFLYNAVFAFVTPRKLGTVLFAPLRVRLSSRICGRIRLRMKKPLACKGLRRDAARCDC